jgi:hypothetical protein
MERPGSEWKCNSRNHLPFTFLKDTGKVMLKQQGRRLSVGMIVDGGSRNPPGIDIAMINE